MKSKKPKDDNHFCKLPKAKQRIFNKNVSAMREGLILNSAKKWVNGTQLNYYFFDKESDGEYVYYTDGSKEWVSYKGREGEKETVRAAFDHWKSQGIGLEFNEISDMSEAEIRIGFMRGDGSWSFLGRDILTKPMHKRTMNFGWNIENDLDTALHEIGHTLGFPHEHQNPNSGIEWNEEKVYEALAKPPNNWKRSETRWNIIRKISANDVLGSEWDPNSIMHYSFGKGLIKHPDQYKNGLTPAPGLSSRDIEWVRFFYPELQAVDYVEIEAAKSQELELENFAQKNFVFKPRDSRKYCIETFGEMDGIVVLFKKEKNGRLRYLTADDDSGEDKNAEIEFKLLKDEEYVISHRQYYNAGKDSAIMIY